MLRIMASFTLRASIAAPIDVVFDVLTDHRGYVDITALRSSTLEREGDPAPNGVGAIRALRLVGPPIREQVTAFDRPRLFAYKMLSGAPVQTHTATVELLTQGSRTELSWQVDSVPKAPVPDAVWSPIIRQVINYLLKSVVKESERRSATG
jgi:Polyketide cyclase / dehydrase and lipid transport